MTRLTAAAVVAVLAFAASVVVFTHGKSEPSSSITTPGAPAGDAATPSAQEQRSSLTSTGTVVRRYGVIEHTFVWRSAAFGNPWEQVRLTMDLTSPSGRRYEIGGFYYGSDRWETRFSPSEVGRWTWQAQLSDGQRQASYRGAFKVLGSKSPGFVRVSPYNRFRWLFANGTPYYPLGIGDCVIQQPGESSPLDRWGLDGGFRPPGIHTDGRQVGMNTYMSAYQSAGVNLFRWSEDNCSFPLYQKIDPSGNVYLQQDGIWGDQLVRSLRSHGFRIFMTFFNQPPFVQNPTPDQVAAIERYVKYVVDRWGPYVDFWELMNETTASPSWYQQVGAYLKQIDPYHHPVSTSWEQPRLPVIDITSPHWYENESQFASDSDTWNRMVGWKSGGKPVIVGEQGNVGHSWYPDSALRMRLRVWTTFFAEGALIFWNASFAKDDVGQAMYLGPQERGYIRVLQRFTSGFDPRASITRVGVSQPSLVRGYGLAGPRQFAAYLVAYTNHTSPTSGVRVSVSPRSKGLALWLDPATGKVLRRMRVHAGRQSLAVPPFTTDIALKVAR